jgi:tellurite resistance protein TerC
LFFGILGAIFFRALFIAIGARLMEFHWVVVFFGVFLIATGIKMMLVKADAKDPKDSRIIKLMKRVIPLTDTFHGQSFFARINGTWVATPLFGALVFLELTDVIFAVDSVPAIFALTKEPLIVFMSNILAIMGMRSLYFMLAGVLDRFIYLKYGLAAVLIFVGLKMAWLNEMMGGKFPIDWSLGIIGALIFGSMGVSLVVTSFSKNPDRF